MQIKTFDNIIHDKDELIEKMYDDDFYYGYYSQITNYHVDKEIIKREQKIDTTELNPQLKVMLEIAKDWKGFDVNKFRVQSQRMNGR